MMGYFEGLMRLQVLKSALEVKKAHVAKEAAQEHANRQREIYEETMRVYRGSDDIMQEMREVPDVLQIESDQP